MPFEYHTSGELGRCAAAVRVEGQTESVQCIHPAQPCGLCGKHRNSVLQRGSIVTVPNAQPINYRMLNQHV